MIDVYTIIETAVGVFMGMVGLLGLLVFLGRQGYKKEGRK